MNVFVATFGTILNHRMLIPEGVDQLMKVVPSECYRTGFRVFEVGPILIREGPDAFRGEP